MKDGNQPEHPDRRAAILMFAIGLLLPATTATGAVVPIPAKGASSRVDAIRQRGVLRVAVLDEYPWLKQNHGQTGEPFQGAAWVLAKEYARRLGVRLQTVPVDFDAKITILARDGADITIAPLLVTPARRAQVDIVSYSVSAQCLFGRADNPKVARATRIDDLDRPDVTVAYNVGSPQGSWILNRVPRAKRLSVRGNLANVPVDAIMSGRADVTTIDKYFFKGLSERTPGLVSVPKDAGCLRSTELPIPIGLAVSKGQPAFFAFLQNVARQIRPRLDAEQARVEKFGS